MAARMASQRSSRSTRAASNTLESVGYHVLRFWNEEVLRNIDVVLKQIAISFEDPHPRGLRPHDLSHRERHYRAQTRPAQ